MQARQHIVVIGAGRLASHLVAALKASERFSLTLFNHRRGRQALALSKRHAIPLLTSYAELPKDASVYMVCVKDSAIAEVAAALKQQKVKGCVMHTSGTMELDVLKGASAKTGVFYPLQTFSAGDAINWSEIPVLIEGNTPAAVNSIRQVARALHIKTTLCKPGERLKIHAAAVIANNFSNALYRLAFEFVSNELSAKHTALLLPLIRQTAYKLDKLKPEQAQTGPAVRGDQATIRKHLALLKKYPQTRKVYELMTAVISSHDTTHGKF